MSTSLSVNYCAKHKFDGCARLLELTVVHGAFFDNIGFKRMINTTYFIHNRDVTKVFLIPENFWLKFV